jgi:hypothetical protein
LDYKIYVFDDKGALAPLTDRGAFFVTGREPPDGKVVYMLGGSPAFAELDPGESKKSDAVINDLYNLSPGKYTVQVERRGSGLKSNTISITITP